MVGTNKSGQVRLNKPAILAEIKRLQIDRAYRDRQGFFYVEGVRNFIRAVDNNFQLSTIVFSEKLPPHPLPEN